jgi:very-short-patch-repair endonuclease
VSALAELGAWVLHRPPQLEVAVTRGSARLRHDAGAIVHWVSDRATPASTSVVGVSEALVRVVLDHDLEVSVPCLDWALSTGRLDRVEFEQLILALPESARCIREWVDPASQSVLESVARVRLRRRGHRIRSQVPVGDLRVIDLVIDDVVALELDGREHHESTFETDRRKDLQIVIEGRQPLRVSYSMLVHDWPTVELAITAALRARGRARRSAIPPPEPRGARHATGAGRIND